MKSYDITIKKRLDPKCLQDLVITFVESGFSPWCQNVDFFVFSDDHPTRRMTYSELTSETNPFFAPGVRWQMTLDVEDPQNEEGRLKKNVGWRKLQWALEQESIRRHVLDLLDEDYDANTCDCIMQVAVYKEVVYG